jgi:hypothetical protein
MYNEVEAHGPSLKEARELDKAKQLDHIRLYAAEGGTPESPRWLVQHHASANDRKPVEHVFDDGHEMLRHVAEHASVPNDNLGREVLPKAVDNLSGRGQ